MSDNEEKSSTQFLHNDIISLIITFLPPKPLTRFKLISKHFLSLINNPIFILSHYQNSLKNLSLAAISHDSPTKILHTLHLPTPDNTLTTTITKLPLPFTSKCSPPEIVGSCNGVLCVSAFPDFLGLVNPTNGTFENIPFDPFAPFGHSESHWVDFGFGFDEIDKDFRVLRVDQVHDLRVDDHCLGPRKVSVFSLKSNSWKKVEDFPYFLSQPMLHGKFLCNSLHWIATTTDPVVFNMTGLLWNGRMDDFVYEYVLVVFDLHLEKFRVLPLPGYGVEDVGKELVVPRLSVGVLGECLFVQVEHGPRFERCVDVWVMKEYGVKDSWVKLLRFPYMEVRCELVPIRVLVLSKKGDEVLMQQGKECFWFEVGSGKMKDVEIEGELPYLIALVNGHRCGFGAVVFVESIVCLSCRVGGTRIEQVDDDDDDSEVPKADEVIKKSKGPKKRGDVLSSRFKLK